MMRHWRILGTALLGALALSLAVGCGDDDPDDGNGAAEITTCAQGCKRVADCLGFADELFGQDENACTEGCSQASAAGQAEVLKCLSAANCTDIAAIAACAPSGD